MIQVPNCPDGDSSCEACFPDGGTPLQFLGIDEGGDLAWLTAPYSNFLYNSSGAQQGNRFNNWADLMAATALIEGPKTITFEQDELLPAGAYDFSQITMRGNFLPLGGGGLFITLDEGVTFTDVTQFRLDGGVGFVNNSSTPNYVIGNGEFSIVAASGNAGFASTNAPVFVIESGGNFVLALADGGVLADIGQPVIEVQAGASLAAVALNGVASGMQDNTITGAGAVFVRLIQGIAIDGVSGSSQPSFSGIVVDQLFTDASLLGYNPAVSGLTATNTQAAIDELAAQNVGIGSYSITGWWDFTVQGGALGEYALQDAGGNDIVIPENAVVRPYAVEEVAVDSATDAGFLKIKLEGSTGELAAVFVGSMDTTIAYVASTIAGHSTTPGGTRLMAEAMIEALTAGRVKVHALIIPES